MAPTSPLRRRLARLTRVSPSRNSLRVRCNLTDSEPHDRACEPLRANRILAMHNSYAKAWLVAFTPAPGSDPESLSAGYLERITSRAELERALTRGGIDVTTDPIAWREYSAQLRPLLFQLN
jgi:hypothetical protein